MEEEGGAVVKGEEVPHGEGDCEESSEGEAAVDREYEELDVMRGEYVELEEGEKAADRVIEGDEEVLWVGEEVPSGDKDSVVLELDVADKSVEEVCEGLFELERVAAKEPVTEALADKEAIEFVADAVAWGEPLPSAVGELESDTEGGSEVFGDAVLQEEGERTPEPVAEGSAVALPEPDSL